MDRAHPQIWQPIGAALIVLLAFGLSVFLRFDTFSQRTGAQGLEASYHALWTSHALGQSTADAHYYLPTVTKAPQPDNPFAWGATVETKGGSFVYTSFPPLGFLLPHALLSWRTDGPRFLDLAFLNSLVGLACALAMGGLARAVTQSLQGSERRGWAIFTLIAVLYLFLRETLVSHGAVYWPHSFSQLALILGAWMCFRIFQGQRSFWTVGALFAVCFFYPALEWTGFVFGCGVCLALYLDWRMGAGGGRPQPVAPNLRLAGLVVLAMILSGLALVAHFALAIGLENLFSALSARASVRAFDSNAAMAILPSYLVSFGALGPLAILAGIMMALQKSAISRAIGLLLFVSAFVMLENVILIQHAFQFSFARLKLAVPLLLIVAIFCMQIKAPRKGMLVAGGVLVVLWSNLQAFAMDAQRYQSWGQVVSENTQVVGGFNAHPQADCLLLGSGAHVRGYLNLLFDRDIVEKTDLADLLAIAGKDDSYCGVALIVTQHVFVDLPAVRGIGLFDRAGREIGRFEPRTGTN